MDAPASLLEVFHSDHLVDLRRAQGRRHPRPAILALTTVAILTGIRSRAGVVAVARADGGAFLRLLGFPGRRGPSAATRARVVRQLDPVAFEAVIHAWVLRPLGTRRFAHIALDGKTLRGRRGADLPAVHLLTALATEVRTPVGPLRVEAQTNEHKAAWELRGIGPVRGQLVTAEAMFTPRDVCTTIGRPGGASRLPVQANQPTRLRDLRAAFADPPAGRSPPTDHAASRPLRAGHDAG